MNSCVVVVDLANTPSLKPQTPVICVLWVSNSVQTIMFFVRTKVNFTGQSFSVFDMDHIPEILSPLKTAIGSSRTLLSEIAPQIRAQL